MIGKNSKQDKGILKKPIVKSRYEVKGNPG